MNLNISLDLRFLLVSFHSNRYRGMDSGVSLIMFSL